MSGAGHNSIAADALRLHIEAIERLTEEKQGIADDIRDRFLLAKGEGYDQKTLRAIIKLRKMDPQARAEQEALLDTYRAALNLD